jgi:ribosomal protein S3AE
MDKLTKKLQVLLSEDEVSLINKIILNEAIESGERPVSISSFIRDIIRVEIDKQVNDGKPLKKIDIRKLKDK